MLRERDRLKAMKSVAAVIPGRGVIPATVVAFGLLALLAGCTSLPPETPPPPPERLQLPPEPELTPLIAPSAKLGLYEAIQRALHRSPELRRLRALASGARSEIYIARQWRDPELRLNYGESESDGLSRRFSYESTNAPPDSGLNGFPDGVSASGQSFGTAMDEGESYRIALRLFPPNPWTQPADIAQAKAEYYAALEQANIEAARIEQEVVSLFAELTYERQELAILDQLIEVRRQVRDEMKRRGNAGQATMQETTDASRRYLDAVNDRLAAQLQQDSDLGSLASRVGIPASKLTISPLEPQGISPNLVDEDLDRLSQQAIEQRPDLRLLGWEAAAAHAGYRMLRNQRIPWLSHIQGSYSVSEETGISSGLGYDIGGTATAWDYDTTHSSDDTDEWEVSVGISIPIFSWISGAAGARRDEWIAIEEARLTAEKQAHNEINRAIDNLKQLTARTAQFETETTPIVAELEEAIKLATENQTLLSPDDIGRLQEQLILTRRLRLETEYAVQEAVIDVHEALGTPVYSPRGE